MRKTLWLEQSEQGREKEEGRQGGDRGFWPQGSWDRGGLRAEEGARA